MIDPRLSAKFVAIRVLAKAEVQVEVQELNTKIDALHRSLKRIVSTGILIHVFYATALLGQYYLGYWDLVILGIALLLSGFRMFLIPKRAR